MKTWICKRFDSSIGRECGQVVVAEENPTGSYNWTDGHRCVFSEKPSVSKGEFTLLNAPRDFQTHKKASLTCSVEDLVAIVGEPHWRGTAGFHDDEYKVDCVWYIENAAGRYIELWNYKDGGYLGVEANSPRWRAEVRQFSAWYSDKAFFELLRIKIARHRTAQRNIS